MLEMAATLGITSLFFFHLVHITTHSPPSPEEKGDYEGTHECYTPVVLILPNSTHKPGYFSVVDTPTTAEGTRYSEIYIHITVLVKSSQDIQASCANTNTFINGKGRIGQES